MMKTIVYAASAVHALDRLQPQSREQVISALELYAMTGRGDVKAMQGRPGYRLRIGRYRIVFAEDAVTVLALYVANRDTTTYR